MGEKQVERLSGRGKRAVAIIALAAIGGAAASIAYLYPTFSFKARPAVPIVSHGPLSPPGDIVTYHFVTPSLGWALEVTRATGANPNHFVIFRTVDGARHWQQQFSGQGTGYGFVQFFDRAHGLVSVGSPVDLYRTVDGGVHWNAIVLHGLGVQQVSFSDASHGWLLASPTSTPSHRLYATSDAGDSWEQLPDPPPQSIAMTFRSPAEGWLWTTDLARPHVYASGDGGRSWQSHELPEPPGRQPGETIVVVDVRLLPGAGVLAYYAFGDDRGYRLPASEFTSFDVGNSWRSVPQRPGQVFPRLESFEDASHWWMLDGHALYKSSDAGQTWKLVSDHLENGQSWLCCGSVLDSKHAWADVGIGDSRGLALTNDGGLHWTRGNVPQPA